MKLPFAQLEAHLAKQLAPIYIVSGEELILKNEAKQWIRKAAKARGFTERRCLIPDAGFVWNDLYHHLHSASLFAEQYLIELDLRDALPNKIAAQILAEYAALPSPAHVLVIDMAKVESKIAKTAWYSALEQAGIAIAIWPLSQRELLQWIKQRAKKYKLQLSDDATLLLADYLEGNLAAAAQAVEKLYLMQCDTVIDVALIHNLFTNETRFSILDFIEPLFAGNIQRALNILQHLKQEGSEAILILWHITRELRLRIDLLEQTQKGIALEQLFQQRRIFSNRQPAIRQFLKRFTLPECLQFLCRAAEIDRLLKGAVKADIWQSLQLFCLCLGNNK